MSEHPVRKSIESIQSLRARAEAAELLLEGCKESLTKAQARIEATEREVVKRESELVEVAYDRDAAERDARMIEAQLERAHAMREAAERSRDAVDERNAELEATLAAVREKAPDWLWGRDEALAELNVILDGEGGK